MSQGSSSSIDKSAKPWTDDLPKCRSTSVGQLYSRGVVNSITNEDQLYFYCNLDDSQCLYGVFEPHNGLDAYRFVMQRMAAEILFQPLTKNSTDEEIRELLRNAFVSAEKAYIQNYDGMIAERTSLQYHYQVQYMDGQQSSPNMDRILNRLKEIDQHLSSGLTVVVALIHYDRLYVANIGESRALLCRTDDNSVLRVVQLSVDHSLDNEDEMLRLRQLGLDVNKIRNAQYLGNQTSTRCLGNYLVKGLFKGFPDLRNANSEPVIAVPEIQGPIILDDSCRFLVLVSSGVYKRLQDLRGNSEQTNKQLAQIVVENFRKTTSFNGLSQLVLEEIYSEILKNSTNAPKSINMTLLTRNFNFPLPNIRQENLQLPANVSVSDDRTNSTTDSRTDSETDEFPTKTFDKDKRIKSYVDFSCYYENVEKARKNGTLPSFIK